MPAKLAEFLVAQVAMSWSRSYAMRTPRA